MSVETSLPWPSNIPELKRLDELLRCGICYEFMSTSMITGCSHNYCSLCIRQYLGYKTQCPACFQETTCQQLRNNRLLDEIIALFPHLRDKIARRCQSAKGNSIAGYLINKEVENDERIETDTEDLSGRAATFNTMLTPDVKSKTSVFSPRKNTKVLLPAETPKRNIGKYSSQSMRSPQVLSTPSCFVGGNISNIPARSPAAGKSPISSGPVSLSAGSSAALTQIGRQSVSGYFSILTERGSTNGNSAQDDPKVSCPVCNVSIPERNINLHLDACLQRMEVVDKGEIICIDKPPKRKPLPKLVYSLLSEKQLRQKLKEIGLMVQGEKQALVNRHRRYTILYNAECDVADPRPIPELLRRVEREEKEEAKGTITKSIFNYDRKTDPEVIEKEQVNYIKKNDKHFSSLIADVKRRQAEAKKNKEMKKEQTEGKHSSAVVPGTSKTVTKQMSIKASANHHMLSSDEDSSDAETNNDKLENNNLEKPKSILNFFKASPLKISQHCERSCHTESYIQPNPVDSNEENFKTTGSFFQPNNENTLPRRDHSLSPAHSTFEVEKENPLSIRERFRLKNDSHSQKGAEDEVVNPSPDFFAASPADSDSSDASISLLHDQELDTSLPSETLLPGNEESNSDNALPKFQPESHSEHDEGSYKTSYDSEDDEIIPAHQPESCPLEEADFEKPPSPSIGRRVTRSKTPSSQSKQQDLSCLGPETQALEFDSQVDPDYEPSQILQKMDIEEANIDATRKTRQSSRKRQAVEAATKVARNVRKRT